MSRTNFNISSPNNSANVGDYERNNDEQYKECPYSDKDEVDDCMDYFMGECQNTCSFCPMENKYGVIW